MSIHPTIPVSNLVRVVTQPTRVTLETVQFRAAWQWSPAKPFQPNRQLVGWSRVY